MAPTTADIARRPSGNFVMVCRADENDVRRADKTKIRREDEDDGARGPHSFAKQCSSVHWFIELEDIYSTPYLYHPESAQSKRSVAKRPAVFLQTNSQSWCEGLQRRRKLTRRTNSAPPPR
jgi:hypothetical protein